MNRKQKRILVWVLTWAGLLVAVLYSPVGSPDLYKSENYYSTNQNVAFNGAKVENTPSFTQSTNQSSQSFTASPYETGEKKRTSYSASYSVSPTSKQVSNSVQIFNDIPTGQTNGNGGMSGGDFAGGKMGGKSSKSKAQSPNNELMPLMTDLTSFSENNNLTRQSANTSTTSESGIIGPGDDPTEPLIPVGDGWPFLLMLAAGYVIWKRIRV